MQPANHGFPGFPQNDLKRKTFRLFEADDAIASQHGNLTKEKLKIAVEEAFSLWSAVTRLSFVEVSTGTPDVPITFRRFGESNAELGNALVDINIDQDFFVDPFTEPDPRPTREGPFDLVRALVHEIGHKLGLEHAPDGVLSAMSAGFAPKTVLRDLFPIDVSGIQTLHGAIQLSGETASALSTAALVDASAGVTFGAFDGAVVVGGPNNAHCIVDCFVDVKDKIVNSIKLKYNTVSRNVTVNNLELWDGLVLLQTYSLASRASGGGLAGKTFNHEFGLLSRRRMQTPLRVRFFMTFNELDGGTNGVAVVQSVVATTIAGEPVIKG